MTTRRRRWTGSGNSRAISASIWRWRWRVKVLTQTAPWFFCAQTLAGREVAERLAGAGAGLRQHEFRVAAGFAGGERGGGGGGVVGLAGALLGVGAEHGGEPGAGLGLGDRQGGGRRQRRGVLPFRQAAPDFQGIGVGRGVGAVQRGEDERRPAPAGGAHAGGECRGVAVQRRWRGPATGGAAGRRRGPAAARPRLPGRWGDRRGRAPSARPRGVGAAVRAGRTKANSSSRSKAGPGRRPRRRKVAGAWTSRGGGRLRRWWAASAADRSRSSPSGVRMAARPCPATTAGASGSAMRVLTAYS